MKKPRTSSALRTNASAPRERNALGSGAELATPAALRIACMAQF